MIDDPGWMARNALTLATVLYAVCSIGLGIAYRVPALTRPSPRPGARTVSIVQYIDSLGPVWLIAFVTAGVLLGGALLLGDRWLTIAHSIATGVTGGFTAAVWLGWAFSDPRPTIVAPVLSVIATGMSVLLAAVYAARRDAADAAEAARKRIEEARRAARGR